MEKLVKSFWSKLTGMVTSGSSIGRRNIRCSALWESTFGSSRERRRWVHAVITLLSLPRTNQKSQRIITKSIFFEAHLIMRYLSLGLAILNLCFGFFTLNGPVVAGCWYELLKHKGIFTNHFVCFWFISSKGFWV
jgi:hypothetical protein